jgi:hypothetical protein
MIGFLNWPIWIMFSGPLEIIGQRRVLIYERFHDHRRGVGSTDIAGRRAPGSRSIRQLTVDAMIWEEE